MERMNLLKMEWYRARLSYVERDGIRWIEMYLNGMKMNWKEMEGEESQRGLSEMD